MRSKRIQVKVPPALLRQIDEAAGRNLTTRSAFVRQSIVLNLNSQQITARIRLDDWLETLRETDNKHRGGGMGGGMGDNTV